MADIIKPLSICKLPYSAQYGSHVTRYIAINLNKNRNRDFFFEFYYFNKNFVERKIM